MAKLNEAALASSTPERLLVSKEQLIQLEHDLILATSSYFDLKNNPGGDSLESGRRRVWSRKFLRAATRFDTLVAVFSTLYLEERAEAIIKRVKGAE